MINTLIGFLIEEIIRRNGQKNMNFPNVCRFNKSQTSQSREWVSDCCLTPTQQFFSYRWRERVNFQLDDDEVRFVLDQHAYFDFYSASSLQQLSTDKQVATLSHIILIPSLCSFSLMLLSREATNTNFIVFGLTRSGLKPTIYHTRG